MSDSKAKQAFLDVLDAKAINPVQNVSPDDLAGDGDKQELYGIETVTCSTPQN